MRIWAVFSIGDRSQIFIRPAGGDQTLSPTNAHSDKDWRGNDYELKAGMNVENLKGKIVEVKEPRDVNTKFGTTVTLTEATLEDDTGSVKLTLWGDQAEGIEEGSEVEITGAFTKEFREEMQISIGKKGSIKVVE